MIIKTKSKKVRFNNLTPAMAYMLFAIERFSNIWSFPDELVITSINDGVHGEKSRHYTDEAIDIRSKNFPDLELKKVFRRKLEHHLNNFYVAAISNRFRVLLEDVGEPNEHFHIQVKKGMKYP